MPLHLEDLPRADRDRGLDVFKQFLRVASLGWPDGVVKQWLYDHGDRPAFLRDYRFVDLSRIQWTLDDVHIRDLEQISTGPSEQDFLVDVATEHQYWLGRRPEGVRNAWEQVGTWLVPPVLISRELLYPAGAGLQVIEGRMRVGILRGRRADGLRVSGRHKAWVGRPLVDGAFVNAPLRKIPSNFSMSAPSIFSHRYSIPPTARRVAIPE